MDHLMTNLHFSIPLEWNPSIFCDLLILEVSCGGIFDDLKEEELLACAWE